MSFEYLGPSNIEEAISMLSQYYEKAKIIAGGTDLVLQIRRKLLAIEYVVDIGGIPGLDYIDYDEKGGLRIGALTTIRTLEKSPLLENKYPVICQACSQLGSVAIRNVATIGGNLCNAAPSADTAPALVGLSAKAKMFGPNGERIVPLEAFFVGPGSTILERGEILIEIQVPPQRSHTRGVYKKFSVRTGDLAIVGVAVIATLDSEGIVFRDAKIVLGAVAPTPMRARRTEETITRKRIDESMIQMSGEVAGEEARPISDVRASARYRREMVKVFTRQAVRELVAM